MKAEISMMKRRVGFGCSISAELLERLDKERGLVPRSRFIEKILIERLSKH